MKAKINKNGAGTPGSNIDRRASQRNRANDMPIKRSPYRKPVAKPPRPKNNPVISLTGQPPAAKQTWWSQRFIEVLESFKMGSRLARGKAYAEEAKVLKLSISSGIVTASVQGSRKAHYRVMIRLEQLSDFHWSQVMKNLTKKAIYAVEMLQDKMPLDIEEVFAASNVSLFPSKLEELDSECDCPDWSNPCKHIAATYYILAQHFDLDPYLIFVWRGRLKTQILESLRAYWRQGKPKTVHGFGGQTVRQINEEEYERYWYGNLDINELTPLDPFSDAVPHSAVKKLGESPIQLEGREVGEVFAETYAMTSESIRAWVLGKERGTKGVQG